MDSKPNASSSSFEPVAGSEPTFSNPNRLIQLLSSIAVMPGGLESKRLRVASELCLDLKANVLISQSLNLAHPGEEPPTCPVIYMHSREKGWQQHQSLLTTEFSDLSKILQDLTNCDVPFADLILHPTRPSSVLKNSWWALNTQVI